VLLHDRESRGALAYLALAGEMIRREDDAHLAQATPAGESVVPSAATTESAADTAPAAANGGGEEPQSLREG